jgi:ankyrin repeat domain-containing protein 50
LHDAHTETSIALDQAEKHCVDLLNTIDIAAYESQLDRRVDGTLGWVTENPQYSMWLLNNETRLLLVTGDAGCGKTILSSYVIQRLTESLPPRGLVCRFFCSGQIEAHRDAKGLMRSIIYQIVRHRKRLLHVVKRASDLQGSHLFDRFDALWDLFVEILHQESVESVNIVIDAIDECDEWVQRMIMERIVELLKSKTILSVKFFLTSRPSTPAVHALNENLISYVRLSLEEKHKAIAQDVNLVIRQRVEAMVRRGKCEPQTRVVLEEMLMKNADRTFLWVSLVLPLIEQRRHLETSDLPNIARQLPEDLTTLYLNFLHSIPEDDRILAGKLLRIVVASARPLNIDEIKLLLIIGPSHHTVSALEAEPAVSRLESIRMILGPLIRIFESKVYLVHQSLKDFLLNLSADQSNPLSRHFGIDLQHETLMLVRSCVRYLALDDFDRDMFSPDRRLEDDSPNSPSSRQQEHDSDDEVGEFSFNLFEDPIFKEQHVLDAEACVLISSYYRLFDYAATYWGPQFAHNNGGASFELHDAVKILCEGQTYRFSNWFRYFWATNITNEPYPKNIGSLFIAAFFGLAFTLKRILTDSHLDAHVQLGPAIYWASRRGHDSCVEKLLREIDIETESCYVNSQSPLLAACEYGHLRCAEALISSGRFNVNEPGSRGRSPLSLASGSGFDDIVRLLLAQKEIDVDLPDRNGTSSLFSAVASNSSRTIPLLLADHRLNPNHLDNLGRSALSWAAAEGYYASTKVLLKDPRVDAGAKDARGRTALSYATQNSHLGIIQLLVRSGRLDVSEMDNEGRNAISWAAQQPQPSVLHYLLKHDRKGADCKDKWGWTPLAWALNPPGYPDNVSILIQSGLVDINRKDRVGRSALSFAAGYGLARIVQLLSRAKGIEVDSRDRIGRTPLSHAAAAGNLDVVQFLIDTNRVDISARDETGRTSLSWAAGEGHIEVIKLLWGVSGVESESRDRNGRTPLDFARLYERHNVIQLFEQIE